MIEISRTHVWVSVLCFTLLATHSALARQDDGSRGSRNMELVSHLPLGGMRAASGSATAGFEALGRTTGDVVLDQQSGRPFVFVAHAGPVPGVIAINISTENKPVRVGAWESPAPVADILLFNSGSKSFLAAMHPESGASILEVSDPDEGQFDPVARIEVPSGLHQGFAYRHSNGRGYLFATGGGDIFVFDLERLVAGSTAPFAQIALPEEQPTIDYGYHSVFVQYEAESETDRMYAGGAGGYYVLDVTDIQTPLPVATVNSAAVEIGHGVTASPDGSHLVTTAGYRTAPMRIFDLRPVFEGKVPRIRTAAGAWTANWRNYAENHQLRWPYVFAAAMDDGLQIFNMLNPFEPHTVGFYYTWDGPVSALSNKATHKTGAWDVDVRNRDGLIAVTDVNTGLWLFKMEGFEGWDGRGWGFPNVSAVQDWLQGPTGSTSW